MKNKTETIVTIIRHGETEWSKKGYMQGHAAVPLSEAGRTQAKALSSYFQKNRETFDILYTSDLPRALETADIIGNENSLIPKPLYGLRQQDVGKWTGITRREIINRFPADYSQYSTNPDYVGHGGESLSVMSERVIRTLREIVREHSGMRLLVVTHSGPIKTIINHILPNNETISISHTSPITFCRSQGRWHVISANDLLSP